MENHAWKKALVTLNAGKKLRRHDQSDYENVGGKKYESCRLGVEES